jgi:hypothetical protein
MGHNNITPVSMRPVKQQLLKLDRRSWFVYYVECFDQEQLVMGDGRQES